jgi:hypothetical protein
MQRIFPTDRLREKYRKLLALEYALDRAQEWNSKSDEWHIEAQGHDLNIEWVGVPPPSEERQTYLKTLQENPAKMEENEKELAPNKVWNDLDLGPVQEESLIEKLLDAWYSLDQVASIPIQESQKPTTLCAPGTQWKDITITLVSNEMVRIQAPDVDERLTYHGLNMADKRKGDSPTMLWELLKLFAQNNGIISSQNNEYNRKLPETAKRLNKHLKKLFGIDNSIYEAHYKKEHAYRTKIKFLNRTFESFSSNESEDETSESPFDEAMEDYFK